MTPYPRSPRLIKGGIVLLDAATANVLKVIPLQYNPDSLARSFQVKGVGGEGGDRMEAMRLTGPPVETIKIEAEIDATDQLEFPKENKTTVESGLHPQIAALEMLIYPPSAQVRSANEAARSGTLEIAPAEMPLTLFVWSKNRIVPVRVTEFSITEEAFDTELNPIRAKVSLGMRVLSVNDLPFDHKGNAIFMAYHQQKERLANLNSRTVLTPLGITRIP